MHISLKRIYNEPADKDDYRVLVDRLWPRRISKKDANLDEWNKEIALQQSQENGLIIRQSTLMNLPDCIERN